MIFGSQFNQIFLSPRNLFFLRPNALDGGPDGDAQGLSVERVER